jgi:DNA-binding SARP family transcriptional activator
MRLLGWLRIDKGALIGRAKVQLPSGLEIADIGIFQKAGSRWAQLPAELLRDADGQPLRDDRGKARYRSPLKWSSRDLQERFSDALIGLIEAEHGPLEGGAQ